jgi:hypothetical protein
LRCTGKIQSVDTPFNAEIGSNFLAFEYTIPEIGDGYLFSKKGDCPISSGLEQNQGNDWVAENVRVNTGHRYQLVSTWP